MQVIGLNIIEVGFKVQRSSNEVLVEVRRLDDQRRFEANGPDVSRNSDTFLTNNDSTQWLARLLAEDVHHYEALLCRMLRTYW